MNIIIKWQPETDRIALWIMLPEVSIKWVERMVTIKELTDCVTTSLPVWEHSPDIQGDPPAVEMVQSLHTEKWDSTAPDTASSMTECHTTGLYYVAAASADDPKMTGWSVIY